MCSRKFFMFSVVLVLALAQVMAWPVKAEKTQEPVVENPVTVEENVLKPSSEEQKTVSVDYNEISTKLDGKLVVVGNDLVTLKEDVNTMSSALAILIADNRALNDSLDEVTKKYEKETSTKYFADFGMVFGFKDKAMTMGAVGEMGLRFGKGFLVKTGIQYSAFELGKIEMPKWSLDDLSMTCTVGWEW